MRNFIVLLFIFILCVSCASNKIEVGKLRDSRVAVNEIIDVKFFRFMQVLADEQLVKYIINEVMTDEDRAKVCQALERGKHLESIDWVNKNPRVIYRIIPVGKHYFRKKQKYRKARLIVVLNRKMGIIHISAHKEMGKWIID